MRVMYITRHRRHDAVLGCPRTFFRWALHIAKQQTAEGLREVPYLVFPQLTDCAFTAPGCFHSDIRRPISSHRNLISLFNSLSLRLWMSDGCWTIKGCLSHSRSSMNNSMYRCSSDGVRQWLTFGRYFYVVFLKTYSKYALRRVTFWPSNVLLIITSYLHRFDYFRREVLHV
jgi:hypothetical protein